MEIFIKSLAGFAITAITLLVAKSLGPTLAGALGGIPIVFAVSYLLVTSSDKSVATKFLGGEFMGQLPRYSLV